MKIKFSGTMTEFRDFIQKEVIDPICSPIFTRITQMSEILQATINELNAKITVLVNENAGLSTKVNELTSSTATLKTSNDNLVAAAESAKVQIDHVVTQTDAALKLLADVKAALDSAGSDTALVGQLQSAIAQIDGVSTSLKTASGAVSDAATVQTAVVAGEAAAIEDANEVLTDGTAVVQSESDSIATNSL